MDRPLKMAVIGAGPAGLVTLKFLATAHEYFPIPPIEVRCFEAEDDIGGIFTHRMYEDAEMVSSKYLTCYSDFRVPDDAPDFLKPADYVQYLRDYIKKFKIGKRIKLSTKVVNISRGPEGKGHVIETMKTGGDGSLSTWSCDAVAVCTGVHGTPQTPQIPGIERVPTSFHSWSMKSRSQFGKDTNVVVLGCGETGLDIAHLAVTSPTSSVSLCSRDGFFCIPKIIPAASLFGGSTPSRPNKPTDTTVASLFDTAYVHPLLQSGPLPWIFYDYGIKVANWLVSGTVEGPDQWAGHISSERKKLNSLFICKSSAALPYISAGKRSESLLNRIRSKIINVPLKNTNGRHIDVKTWPTMVDEEGIMHFEDESQNVRADIVVFATGYSAEFPFLSAEYPRLSDIDVRNVYKEGDESVGFIGFVRPSLGAIPPLAEMQTQLWIYRYLRTQYPKEVPLPGPDAVPTYDIDYLLSPLCGYDFATTKRGVDHESYAYQLALDMGSAPTITHVATKGWKLFFTWAMGSNFNPKFRMIGPWKRSAEAEKLMRNELYNVVKRSDGVFYVLFYTLLPVIVFGSLSLLLYGMAGLLSMSRDFGLWVSRLASSLKRRFVNTCSQMWNDGDRGVKLRSE